MSQQCRKNRCIGQAGQRGSCPHGHDTVIKKEERKDPETGGMETWTLEYAPECCAVREAGIVESPPSSLTSGSGPCIPGTLLREYVYYPCDDPPAECGWSVNGQKCGKPLPCPVPEHQEEFPNERMMCCKDGCSNKRPCIIHEAPPVSKINGHLVCDKCGSERAEMSQQGGGRITRWPCSCGGYFHEKRGK